MFEVSSMTRLGYTLNASAISLFLSLVVAVSCSLSLIVPSGYTLGYALLLLASIPLLSLRSTAVTLTDSSKCLIAVLLAYFLLHAVGNLVQGSALRRYDESAHYLLAIPILWLLCKFPLNKKYWWAGVGLGAIGGGIFALFQVFYLGYFRANGFMVAIQFGDLCILFGAFCLIGIGAVYKHSGAFFWLVLLGLGAAMGLLGSLLSGARGGWLVLPLVLLLVFFTFDNQSFRRALIRTFLVGTLGVVALYWVPQTGIESRIKSTVSDYQSYASGADANTSLGVRLEMWRLSSNLIAERPVFGWGETGYQESLLARIDNPDVKATIAGFDHVHNDILDVLVKRGVVGLFALLLIFVMPLRLFLQYIKHDDVEVRSFATAGAALVLCMFIFGLSQTFFIHNSGVTTYAFFLVVIWSLLQNSIEKKASNSKENNYDQ